MNDRREKMKLIDYSIKDFSNELASNSPAPGGGSTAAIEAGFGVSLIAMVCELTIANKKYAEHIDLSNQIKDEAKKLQERLMQLVDEDSEAFNVVSAAFSMNKETEEEKSLRRKAIQDGLKGCVVPPMEVLSKSCEGLNLIKKLIDNYNTSTASDLGTAIGSLKAAGLGAYLNVLINIGSIKDEEFVKENKDKADNYIKQIDDLYNELIDKIFKQL